MLRIVSCIAALAGLLTALATPAAAEERYPNRQVRIIVPFPAGGPIDVMARLVGQKLTPTLGQVIIENRPGGGSTVGLKAAVTAEPDGHTLMFGGLMTLSVLPTMSKALDIDPLNGFAPIVAVSGTPFVLIVPPRVSARTVQQLIAYAREHPARSISARRRARRRSWSASCSSCGPASTSSPSPIAAPPM